MSHDPRALTPHAAKALLAVARAAVEARARGRRYSPPVVDSAGPLRGAFVTLTDRQGTLRGCIGHLQPFHQRLEDEVAAVAASSASEDARFRPVSPSELPELVVSISLLDTPEEVRDRAELDPRRYGVIVTRGQRRGVLLPDLEGVDTVEAQLSIACRKAGIRADETYDVQRFEVVRIEEE